MESRLPQAREKLVRAQKEGATALTQLTGWHRNGGRASASGRSPECDLGSIRNPIPRNCRVAGRRLPSSFPRKRRSIRERESSLRSLALEQDVPSEEAVLGCSATKGRWLAAGAGCLARGCQRWGRTRGISGGIRTGWTPCQRRTRRACKHADTLADRLRREADRVARKAELQAALERHQASCAELERELKSARGSSHRPEKKIGRAGCSAGQSRPSGGRRLSCEPGFAQREEVVKLARESGRGPSRRRAARTGAGHPSRRSSEGVCRAMASDPMTETPRSGRITGAG